MYGRYKLRCQGTARSRPRGASARSRTSRASAFRRAAAALGLAIAIAPQTAHAGATVRWAANGSALCTATGNQQNPRIVADGAGGAIVTWQDGRSGGSDIYAQRVRADGTVAPGWPAQGVALCTAAFNQTIPQIVTDGAGGAIVTWQDGRSGTPAIYAQRVLAAGTVDPGWPLNGVAVGAGVAGVQAFPQIASDGAGGAIVTWQDERNGNPDIFAQRIRSNGAADPLWPASGVALCTAVRAQSSPHAVSDGASGAIVAWADSRNTGGAVDIPDIYAQRVLSTGRVDPAWPANGVGLCTVFGTQLDPQIAPDGAGGAIVTWYDRRSGQPADPIYQDIFAQRVSSAGVPQWTPDGVALCTATSTQVNPRIVPDGAGGAIVVWQDHRGDNYDIYAQHARADSTLYPGLPRQGAPLCTAGGGQEAPQLVPDGAGGAIVTWQDARDGSTYDIYAQRMMADGSIAPGWPAGGIALCTAVNTQQKPQIASDGAGGAIVAWQDGRPTGLNQNDIYAQRVSDNLCGAAGAHRGLSLLQACPVVEWTNASGGVFFDAANWNVAVGPVPSGVCPVDCSPYDARFGIGGATYGVDFGGNVVTGEVRVRGGDRPTFRLAGSTWQLSRLEVAGPWSTPTISGGRVKVSGRVYVDAAATGGGNAILEVDPGCTLCAGSIILGEGGQMNTHEAAIVVSGGALSGCPSPNPGPTGQGSPGGVFTDTLMLASRAVVHGIVLGPGGVLNSTAPLSFDLTNSGTLSPGSVVWDVGALAVEASYTQTSSGRLVIDIDGGGCDVLRVTGPATLGGSLEWKLVHGYLPAIGERFEVLVAHPLIGTFDSVREDIDVVYTDTSVVLIATETTPVLASFVNAETDPGRAHLRWHVGRHGGPVTIRRDRGTGSWDAVATRHPDGSGFVEYEDTQVSAARYGYRLGLPSDAGEVAAGEVWLEVPAAIGFALAGASPNPSRGPLTVSFSLGDTRPARLELFDLAGRLVESRAVESPRPGGRVLTLGTGRKLPPGVYQLQLSQGARRASSPVVIVR